MARSFDTTVGRVLETFETDKELTLRAAPDTLAFASRAELAVRLTQDEKSVEAVRLTVDMFRSEVLKLAQVGDIVSLSVMDLVRYAPMAPITLTFDAGDRLVEALGRALAAGEPLEECVTRTGDDAFPAFFDLVSYRHVDTLQKT